VFLTKLLGAGLKYGMALDYKFGLSVIRIEVFLFVFVTKDENLSNVEREI